LPLRYIGVIALELLLGPELYAEVGELALSALSVLAWTVVAFVDRALRPAEDIFAEPAIKLVFCFGAFRHLELQNLIDGQP